jgi:hypothetical protein
MQRDISMGPHIAEVLVGTASGGLMTVYMEDPPVRSAVVLLLSTLLSLLIALTHYVIRRLQTADSTARARVGARALPSADLYCGQCGHRIETQSTHPGATP